MPKIVFRGKTYYSVFAMPEDIRRAYQLEKRSKEADKTEKRLTDFVEMSDELKELYDRVAGKVDKEVARTKGGKTKNDDAFYRPSPPPLIPGHPTIEPDDGGRRLLVTLLLLVLIGGATFYIIQFM